MNVKLYSNPFFQTKFQNGNMFADILAKLIC